MDKIKKRGYYAFNTKEKDKVELLFTMLFWARLEEKGYGIGTVEKTLAGNEGVMAQLKALAAILSSAHDNYSSKSNVDSKYTEEEFLEMLEEDVTEDIMQEVISAMMDTKIFGKSINGNVKRGGKSKAAGKPQRSTTT